ncbi:hypothetical protein ABQZ99_015065 [Xanthomonas hortorum pv. vitians]|uniref:SMODS and SLOG-associating 2TM effector domain-containing protein n=2 Tax=Xanthomonas hortorum TaxID=56454 RepID=A0A6V7D0Z2_9XANT|nr:hypothetical protein [Xanthomonas hortorum]MCC8494361.1 hypothetical protein [Xanthomonas hortorum pv. gardneri]MCE4279690.1 hypothetical protein [Xanthomonas hortorum pv. vitians]MCE4286146.1 hypothetical protein [Xanthomonas hortorum pv. vitians]MCE4290915.1 hypothetical protein [Xanthomonas hortorum pv. vitians]MCE4295077.1 hypothetical protein [Xanthomonas hortorum pv. vitians]
MGTERSDKVYDNWRTSSEKFDYFVLALLGALCAYVANKFTPALIGFNPKTLEVISLLVFFFSTFLGFRRVEYTINLTGLNHRSLRANEQRGMLVTQLASGQPFINSATGDVYSHELAVSDLKETERSILHLANKISLFSKKAEAAYSWRNHMIFIGFILLVASKIWTPYFLMWLKVCIAVFIQNQEKYYRYLRDFL